MKGAREITEMWKNEYYNLFNYIEASKVNSNMYASTNVEVVTPEEVAICSDSLSAGKAIGMDGIPSELMKYGTCTIYKWLSKFFSWYF